MLLDVLPWGVRVVCFHADRGLAEQDPLPRHDVGTCEGDAAVFAFCKSVGLAEADADAGQTDILDQNDDAIDLTQPEKATRPAQAPGAATRCMARQSPDVVLPDVLRPAVHSVSSSEGELALPIEGYPETVTPGVSATPQSRCVPSNADRSSAAQRESGKVARKRRAQSKECVPRRVARTSLTHLSSTQRLPVTEGNQGWGSFVQDNMPVCPPGSPLPTSTELPPVSVHEGERFVISADAGKTDEYVGQECGVLDATGVLIESPRGNGSHVLQELPNVGNLESNGIVPEPIELPSMGVKKRQLTRAPGGVSKQVESAVRRSSVAATETPSLHGPYLSCASLLAAPHKCEPAPQKLPEHLRIDMRSYSRSKAVGDCYARAEDNPAGQPVPAGRRAVRNSMPPPPRKDQGPGWRQRAPQFEVNDHALGMLAFSRVLDCHNAAPAPVRPAIVDQKPSETSARAENNRKGMDLCCCVLFFCTYELLLLLISVMCTLAGFKYVESVRKQAARRELQGVECVHCRQFYDALDSWGVFDKVPGCGHISEGAIPCSVVLRVLLRRTPDSVTCPLPLDTCWSVLHTQVSFCSWGLLERCQF